MTTNKNRISFRDAVFVFLVTVHPAVYERENDVSEETSNDAVGDATRDRHEQNGKKGGHRLCWATEVNMSNRTEEVEASHNHDR